jgi:hypothetical protein
MPLAVAPKGCVTLPKVTVRMDSAACALANAAPGTQQSSTYNTAAAAAAVAAAAGAAITVNVRLSHSAAAYNPDCRGC